MIQIKLRPELEMQMSAEAQARGLALEQYIVERLEGFNASRLSAQPGIGETIEHLPPLRQEQAAQRDAAVDAMGRFAAQHGFTSGGEDLKTMAHAGHKY